MATSRAAALGLAALTLAAAGCGSGAGAGVGVEAGAGAGAGSGAGSGAGTGEFAWLRPGAAPAGWRRVSISTGAVMPYPPGWRLDTSDAGTATAVLRDAHRDFLGYLNLTPHQGRETLTNWASFRIAHNADEGDRSVKTLDAAQHLRFRTGSGTCVRDSYRTVTGARFTELACLVKGPRAMSVIVGAAPPTTWTKMSPSIEKAISAFTT